MATRQGSFRRVRSHRTHDRSRRLHPPEPLRTRKTADPPADRLRREMATQAVTLAGVVMIFGVGLVIGLVILIDGRASVWIIVAPTLGTMSWLALSLWKSAERLSLPTSSMAYRPAAIRAMTGQRLRKGAARREAGIR